MEDFKFTEPISTDIYHYYPPLYGFKGFISIPHSGLTIPDEFSQYFNENLTTNQVNEDVDYAVDQLVNISELQSRGIAVLVAKIHRACIDLNRSPETAVFSWKSNSQGIELISSTITVTQEQIDIWIKKYHQPYFTFLSLIIKEIESIKMGLISLLDLHSMPSLPTLYHLTKNPNQSRERRKDFCFSDLKGLSCQKLYISSFFEQLTNSGQYSASINDPYVGGYITQYMDETFCCNVIQCEINRDIYMDEMNKELIMEKVEALKPLLTQTIIDIFTAFNTPFVKHQKNSLSQNETEKNNEQFAFEFQ